MPRAEPNKMRARVSIRRPLRCPYWQSVSLRCLIRAGYYWPTMKKEVADYIKRCEQCQKYAPTIHQAGEQLHSVTSPWSFIKWGMDIVEPLPTGRGNKKLEDAKGLWPGLLPEVLWAYRTTPKTSTGEMPYSLVHGTDAMIPVEVREPSLRYSNESGPRNDENRKHDLDEAEERRDMAYIRAQKHQAERYYNKKAK
uniref:Uncharacterized protein LOC104241532 n=1 Tax=Nicotiana sylvestris TaxID=4096 RepID=A0A1U7XYS6_NICSY